MLWILPKRVNNVAAPKLATYQIQQSACECVLPSATTFTISEMQRTCITLHGWGSYQSYYEPLDKIRVQSEILNPDSIIPLTCARLFLLSVSPCVFLCCFFQLVFTQPCIPPLHWSHSQMGLIVVYSLLPFIFTSFYSFLLPFLSFLFSFPFPFLLAHLSGAFQMSKSQPGSKWPKKLLISQESTATDKSHTLGPSYTNYTLPRCISCKTDKG